MKYKNKLIMFLGLIYILTFTLFGILYWRIANLTSGDFFIFKEDINNNIKISEFKKKLKINNSNRDLDRAIKKLLINKEYQIKAPLGEDWAEYYYNYFKLKGADYFTFNEIGKKDSQQNETMIKITLYNFQSSEEIAMVYANFLNYPFDKGMYPGNYYYPMEIYFKNIIESSTSYLDQSPIYLKNIQEGEHYYSLLNFMYFSVVTITTLGYGDILPNSTMVRVLVMFESISGVVIMGMFASSIFWNEK